MINKVSFSYNASVYEGTDFTPHKLIFGTSARIPSSLNFEELDDTYSYYLTNLFEEIRELQDIARTNLQRVKEKSKGYDKRVNQTR